MRTLLQDLRFSLRVWRNTPTLTATAILTLGLGIGGATVVYSVVRGVLWRPLPYDNYERLVHLFEARPEQGPNVGVLVSVPTFEDWKRDSRLIEDFARTPSMSIAEFAYADNGAPTFLTAHPMSADVMRLFGARPILGRAFTSADEAPGATPVMLLDYWFWWQRFEGAEDVVGREIRMGEGLYTVVGVMPKGFEYPPGAGSFMPTGPAGWVPAPTDSATVADRTKQSQYVFGVLKPGVSEEEARDEITAITTRLSELHSEKEGWSVRLIGIHSRFHKYSREKTMLLTLLAAVGFVLLITGANMSGLLLTRTVARAGEIAVRASLGASARRIVQQLLVESLALALIGGSLGVLVAFAGFEALKARLPSGLPRSDLIEMDWGVLLLSLSATALVGVAFGALPALSASRLDLSRVIQDASFRSGAWRGWAGDGLVLVEVAICTVLLVGAGLTAKTFLSALNDETGFALEEVLTARPRLHQQRYGDEADAKRFHDEVAERVRALPGVMAAGWVDRRPFQARELEAEFSIALAGRTSSEPARVNRRMVGDDFFEAAGVALQRGRGFQRTDNAQSAGVAVVSQEAARRYWPDRTPVGELIKPGGLESPFDWVEIVGVVGDAKMETGQEAVPTLYLPLRQITQLETDKIPRYFAEARAATLLVRTESAPAALADAVRDTVRQVDATQPVDVETLVRVVERSLEPQRFSAITVAVFAAFALLLAVVGMFATLSHSVVMRTREIGVRVAIGAQRRQIFGQVIGRALGLTVAGIALGLASSWGLTRVLQGQIYGIEGLELSVLVGVAAAAVLASAGAAYLPARRAMSIDPNVALRQS